MNPEVMTPEYVTELARKFRRDMTRTEKKLSPPKSPLGGLVKFLNGAQVKGYRFRRQHPVYRYVLDFYCSEARLALEIDGEVHNQKGEYDEYRDDVMKSLEIETLRIMSVDVENDINSVLARIAGAIEKRAQVFK